MAIFIGYQGVGKSTLAGKNKFVDLESSNFKINGRRSKDWYIPYCNIAHHLSEQGYKVFTSSHKEVRDELSKYNGLDKIYTITPDTSLKDEWVDKLKCRWFISKLDKDYYAYLNAEDNYTDNISEILDTPFEHIIIESMNYDLEDMLFKLV